MALKDTEGARFVVFHQEATDKPHRHAGSVHAPDAAMALLHARDVFVRRPECVSLWVAPAGQVYGRTAEELEASATHEAESGARDAVEYEVFVKRHQKGAFEHAGRVSAHSPAGALQAAIKLFGQLPVLAWWLLPKAAIHRSDPDEDQVLFGPAKNKDFRRSTYFHTLTRKRALRGDGTETEDES